LAVSCGQLKGCGDVAVLEVLVLDGRKNDRWEPTPN